MINLEKLAAENLTYSLDVEEGREYPNNKPYPYPVVNPPYATNVKKIYVKNDSQRFVPPQNINITTKTFTTINRNFNQLFNVAFEEL